MTVGIFWYFNDGMTYSPTIIYDVEVYNIQSESRSEYNLITYSKQHKDAWKEAFRNSYYSDKNNTYAYDDFPRGRVWYDTEEKHFIVSYDEKLQCILNEMKEDIFHIFGIEEHNTIWEINPDYKSKRDIFTCRYDTEKISTIYDHKEDDEDKVDVYLIKLSSNEEFNTTLEILHKDGFERENEKHCLILCDYLLDCRDIKDFTALLNYCYELYCKGRLILLKNQKYERLMYVINTDDSYIFNQLSDKEKEFSKILKSKGKFINFIEKCLFDYCKVDDFLISNYYRFNFDWRYGDVCLRIDILRSSEEREIKWREHEEFIKNKRMANYSAYVEFCENHPNWHFINFDKHIEIFENFKIKKIPKGLF